MTCSLKRGYKNFREICCSHLLRELLSENLVSTSLLKMFYDQEKLYLNVVSFFEELCSCQLCTCWRKESSMTGVCAEQQKLTRLKLTTWKRRSSSDKVMKCGTEEDVSFLGCDTILSRDSYCLCLESPNSPRKADDLHPEYRESSLPRNFCKCLLIDMD